MAQPDRLKFKRLKSMPRGKYDMAYASDGQLLYLIGGAEHRRNLSNNIFTYHTKYRRWLKLRTGKEMEPHRMGSAVYYAPQERIYLFGGVGEFEPERSAVRFVDYQIPAVRFMDSRSKRWSNWGENQHQGAKLGLQYWKEKIYLFGGSKVGKVPDLGYGFLATVHEFDPRTASWRSLPDMPHAKETQGCIIDGVLYTFGGFNGSAFRQIHALDLARGQWTLVGNLPSALQGHVVVAWKKYAIIIGDQRRQNYLAVYDTESGQLKEFKTNMKGHSRGACVVNGKLYVFGGLVFVRKKSVRNTLFELELEELDRLL